MSFSSNQEQVGSLNEAGIIYDLKKCGYTDFSSICEIVGNSIDASANNFQFKCQMHHIKFIDDGLGMDKEKAKNMFDLCRENHSGERSIGISGKGAKGATLRLSRDKTIIVYTGDGNSFLKITVPWDLIFQNRKYTGMITIENMDKKEEEEFLEDRVNFESKTGTTIVIPNNKDEEVYNEILNNFNSERLNRKCNNRIDCIFGNFNTKISLVDMNDIQNNVENLEMYNYFGFPDTHYYKYKFEDKILIYQHKKDNSIHYIWEKDEDEYYNMPKVSRGISKTPRQCRIDKSNWKYIGLFNVKNGFLKDKTIFDDTNPDSSDPKRPTKTINLNGKKTNVKSKTIGEYDEKFFNTHKKIDSVVEDLSNCSIFRNNHRINDKTIDNFKSTNARSDPVLFAKIALLRTSLSYDTMSNQDNLLDKIIGVQSNKNQLNSDGFPKELMYMLTYIKQQAWEEIKTYFKTVYEVYNREIEATLKAEEESSDNSVFDSEEDDDSDLDSEEDDSDLDSDNEQLQISNVENKPNQTSKAESQTSKAESQPNKVEPQAISKAESQTSKAEPQQISNVEPQAISNVKHKKSISDEEFFMSDKAKLEMFNQWIESTKEMFNQNYKNITTNQFEQIGRIFNDFSKIYN